MSWFRRATMADVEELQRAYGRVLDNYKELATKYRSLNARVAMYVRQHNALVAEFDSLKEALTPDPNERRGYENGQTALLEEPQEEEAEDREATLAAMRGEMIHGR